MTHDIRRFWQPVPHDEVEPRNGLPAVNPLLLLAQAQQSWPPRVSVMYIERLAPDEARQGNDRAIVQNSGQQQRPATPALRAVLPGLGVKRVVPWGEFKALLKDQVEHPERLPDAFRLPCRVQVYEAAEALRLEEIAQQLGQRPMRLGQLALHKLRLTDLVRAPERPTRSHPDLVCRGERVFLMRVLQDPTRGPASERSAAASSVSGSEHLAIPPMEAPTPAQPAFKSAPATAPGATLNAVGPRKEIPERFCQPWQVSRSREEALHDMALSSAPGGQTFLQLLGSVLRHIVARRVVARWKDELRGRTLDEQLWLIRPPRGAVGNNAFRSWVARTLQLAGYDPALMLVEWEIHWRRQGL